MSPDAHRKAPDGQKPRSGASAWEITADSSRPGEARTDGDLVANAYVIRSAEILAEAVELLDHKGDAARFRAHATAVRERFADHVVTPDGPLSSDTQTAYTRAEVQLPDGSDPFDIGSGRHTFRCLYAAPAWPPTAIHSQSSRA